MDETQRSAAGTSSRSRDFTINEGDQSINRLAPVSIKAGNQLTEVFSELDENWKKYTEMEEGDRIGAIIKDLSVEEQLERMEHMPLPDMLNVVRFHLRKMTTLKEENELLTGRNRELSEQLHRVEYRVGKAQNQVFDKMHKSVRQIVEEFHIRELYLARKLEESTAENSELTTRNSKLETKIGQLEAKIEDLEQKNQSLSGKNQNLGKVIEEKQTLFDELAKKFDEQAEEIFQLRERLEQTKHTAREKSDEAVQEALEAQNLRILIVKQKDEIWEQARRHENALKKEMDQYRATLEQQMTQMRRKCKDELEAMTREHRTAQFQQESRIQALANELEGKNAEVKKFERHLEMMEAQIKGNMKRSLAVNYQEMLNIISDGPTHIPTPPYSNPLLDLARDFEKENASKRRLNSGGRTSCPSSPKRTIGVQAATAEPPEPLVVRKLMPASHPIRARTASTSRVPFQRK
uniref:Uncharacterized protein n=1 Tax=Caenorhabditis japonica TaxID=281687 RepID=A0A8R1HUJ2_CAEJA